ncbi:DsbA family protein [Microbacterium halophytorum]|uniref:DsbA family protein n=1 Tax=Microbacterium halophytorum TaxID=2067568 RepID=UPI000CFCF20D|nr:thioredoxin domain-containing protein [Microbacterium halophytorum]
MAEQTDRTAAQRTRPSRTARRWLIGAGLVCAFAIIVVVGQLTSGGSSGDAPDAAQRDSAEQPAASPDTGAEADGGSAAAETAAEGPYVRREEGDPMAIGDVDAPVVLVEWTDMRCPFCAAFSVDSLPTIVEEYVDAGKVRLEVNDVAFFGEESAEAAVAARAAGEQGKFFEYLRTAYAAAPESGHPDMPREKLIAFAEDAGVPDLDRFAADLDSPELRAAADESTQYAQRLGVNSVPFFVAGETAVAGAQPLDVFRDFLDEAIAGAE